MRYKLVTAVSAIVQVCNVWKRGKCGILHSYHFTCDYETLIKGQFPRRSKLHICASVDRIHHSVFIYTRWLDPAWIWSKLLVDKFRPVELDPVLDMIQNNIRHFQACPIDAKMSWKGQNKSIRSITYLLWYSGYQDLQCCCTSRTIKSIFRVGSINLYRDRCLIL